MVDFSRIMNREVTKAFDRLLTPGGLVEEVTFKFYVSEGIYDVELDTTEIVWNDVENVNVVVAKPTSDDMKDSSVIRTDVKLILPGSKLPSTPETDTDKVVRANGEIWDVRKTMDVPGRSVIIVYIYRT